MKIKSDTRLLATLGILLVVAIAPISSSVFAQTNTSNDSFDKNSTDEKKNLQKEQRMNLKEIKEEKIRQIRNIASDINSVAKPLPFDEVIDIPDREPDLVFSGETSGWAIIGGKAHESAISLSGFAYKSDEDKVWKVVTDGVLSVADRDVKLEMKGYARSNHVMLYGTGHLEGGDSVRVVLRGNFAPTSEDGIYAIIFTHALIQTDNSSERLKMMQVGSVTVKSTGNTPEPEA